VEEREAELLPVPYFHVVFTLPAAIGDIAYQNKSVIYDLLFKASAETIFHGLLIGVTQFFCGLNSVSYAPSPPIASSRTLPSRGLI
jgi:hypothetical protein